MPREIEASKFVDLPCNRYVRELAGFISERNRQQLFCKSIETPQIKDEHGVPFQIFYCVSNNARTFWSITNARKVINYQPQDDSERRFAVDSAWLLSERSWSSAATEQGAGCMEAGERVVASMALDPWCNQLRWAV